MGEPGGNWPPPPQNNPENIRTPLSLEEAELGDSLKMFDCVDNEGKQVTVKKYDKANEAELVLVEELNGKIEKAVLPEDVKAALHRMLAYVKAPTIVYSIDSDFKTIIGDFRTKLTNLTTTTDGSVSDEMKKKYVEQCKAISTNRLKRPNIGNVLGDYKNYFEEEDGVHLDQATRDLGESLMEKTLLKSPSMEDYNREAGHSYGEDPTIPYDEMGIEEKIQTTKDVVRFVERVAIDLTTEKQISIPERIKRDHAYGEKLKMAGYVEDCMVYEDPYSFADLDLSDLSEIQSARSSLETLIELIQNPILPDSIEELGTNHQRQEIRAKLAEDQSEEGVAIYAFYHSNKLESSNVGALISTINELNQYVPLPEVLRDRLNECREAFTGSSDMNNFAAGINRYKKELNNKEKLDLVKKVTVLTEEVLLHAKDTLGLKNKEHVSA